MTCRACLGPTMSSKVTSVIRGAACCGPRGSGAKRSGCCNAKAPGSSYPGHRQRPKSWMPCVTLRPRTWHRNGSALLRIASVSAFRAGPCDSPKHNSINCVRSGWRPKLQVQGDFCGIAAWGMLDALAQSLLAVDWLTLFDVVQQAEIQGLQMIALRLRWPSLHTEEPDNGGMAVVAAICMRHQGLEELRGRGFNVA